MKKIQLKSFFQHLILFVLIEVLFIFILFRELPETNILSAIGIWHSIYWVVLLLAAFWREKTHKVWQRFLATYTPVVAHLVMHLWVWVITLETYDIHAHEEEGGWLILWVIMLGVLIYRGEWLLHRNIHCETHHHKAHSHCVQKGHDECEDEDMWN